MKQPTLEDTAVKVSAYLTDERFGYEHWRAAQFAAPTTDAKPALLLIFTSEEKRDEAFRLATVVGAAGRTGPPLDPWQPIETAPPATNVLPPAPCPITPLTVLGPATLLHWATAAVFGEKVPAEVQDEPLIQAIQRLREAGRPPVEPERER